LSKYLEEKVPAARREGHGCRDILLSCKAWEVAGGRAFGQGTGRARRASLLVRLNVACRRIERDSTLDVVRQIFDCRSDRRRGDLPSGAEDTRQGPSFRGTQDPGEEGRYPPWAEDRPRAEDGPQGLLDRRTRSSALDLLFAAYSFDWRFR